MSVSSGPNISAASVYSHYLENPTTEDQEQEHVVIDSPHKKQKCAICIQKLRNCCSCVNKSTIVRRDSDVSDDEKPPRCDILGWIRQKVLRRSVKRDVRIMEDEAEWQKDLDRANQVTPGFKDWLNSTYRKDLKAPADVRKQRIKARRSWYISMAAMRGRSGSIVSMREFSESDFSTVDHLLKHITSWNFDSFDLDEKTDRRSLSFVIMEIFRTQDFMRKFRIKATTLRQLLKAFEAGYTMHGNEYHNQRHAADVTQTVYAILATRPVLYAMFTDLEIFALIFAAMIHDLAHPGTTNNFQVNSQSHLALLYNDRSVLENHHVSSAFQILRNSSCNILENLKMDEFKEFRFLVIDFVLATDMAGHFQHVNTIRTYVKSGKWENTSTKAISAALSFVLHAADIGNPTKPWDNHKKCADAIMMEYQAQGVRERSLKLQISPLCNPKDQTPGTQITFIEVLARPTFETLGDLLDLIAAASTNRQLNLEVERRRRATLTESSYEFQRKKPGRTSILSTLQILRGRTSKTEETINFTRPWQANLVTNIAEWRKLVALTSSLKQNRSSSGSFRKSRSGMEKTRRSTVKFSRVGPTELNHRKPQKVDFEKNNGIRGRQASDLNRE